MNLIKFSNGKWGIRKGWLFYKYLWLVLDREGKFTVLGWSSKDTKEFSKYCMAEEYWARRYFEELTNENPDITDEIIESK